MALTSATTPIVHLELHTGDLGAARAFYAALCGWKPEEIEAAGRRYQALETGGGISGGIVECPVQKPIWLPYVEVENIGRATDRARLAGATVMLEPREGPAGWRSVVTTPHAGELAFWQQKR